MRTNVLSLLFLLLVFSCNSQPNHPTDTTASGKRAIDSSLNSGSSVYSTVSKNYADSFIWQENPQGYSQTVSIMQNSDEEYGVHFSASSVKGKSGGCFDGKSSIVNETLKIPFEWNGKHVTMTLFTNGGTLHVFIAAFEDRFALNYYCSGGGSLAGEYYRVRR